MEQEMAEMTDNTTPTHGGERSLLERLAQGPVICAEGYLFELARRGYLQAGAFVPEVVLEHPEAVTRLHEDFVHAGSDVAEAVTYYAHREQQRGIGCENDPRARGWCLESERTYRNIEVVAEELK